MPDEPDAHPGKCKPTSSVEIDPATQSPDEPIEFCADDDVARGNAERANAEPEPAALHAAEAPGKPDVAERRRKAQHDEE